MEDFLNPALAKMLSDGLGDNDAETLKGPVLLAGLVVVFTDVDRVKRGGENAQEGDLKEASVIGDGFRRVGEGREVGRARRIDEVDQRAQDPGREGALGCGVGNV
ncbi:hypothetical protein BC938DRAFT_483154 [Jimgerdemannia flammicorona]|uniref:Uncharacterized protein n=1 Tax=Jimgerdemannia flammicorona TaxID=994334 RepID=A0A433QCL7_9FUNG|nr:hypothetical protein BC938DRAFT_483154 [Jimgerdemannia flammicorona]